MSMPKALHQQYLRQAAWTQPMRQYLLSKSINTPPHQILEVGCGTGVILNEMQQIYPDAACFGIDLETQALRFAQKTNPQIGYAQNNASFLPFFPHSFDLVFCHFFLLWAIPLAEILFEMIRVLRPGAPLIAFAEPDYGGRIDYPPELETLGQWQEQSLLQRGAQPRVGRCLADLFQQAGLDAIELSLIGGEWKIPPAHQDLYTAEWNTLESDLQSLSGFDQEQYNILKTLAKNHEKSGSRLLYVPTFTALGFKPCESEN